MHFLSEEKKTKINDKNYIEINFNIKKSEKQTFKY